MCYVCNFEFSHLYVRVLVHGHSWKLAMSNFTIWGLLRKSWTLLRCEHWAVYSIHLNHQARCLQVTCECIVSRRNLSWVYEPVLCGCMTCALKMFALIMEHQGFSFCHLHIWNPLGPHVSHSHALYPCWPCWRPTLHLCWRKWTPVLDWSPSSCETCSD